MHRIINCAIASILFVLQATTLSTAQNNITNPALWKQAIESGVYANFTAGRDARLDANRAVDGYRYSTNESRYCSRVDTSDPRYHGNKNISFWQVDLADTYTVSSVTIFNTNNETEWQFLSNFTVYVTLKSDVTYAEPQEICQWVRPTSAADTYPVPRNGFYTINCTRPIIGQYITIQRIWGLSPGRMTLCEVEVQGTRYYSCENCRVNCSHTTGCPSCNPGFVPPTCTKYCEPGTYGINCVNQCQPCTGTELPCDSVTGECPCLDTRPECTYSYDTALKKQATQSGMYAGLDASRAVDGHIYSQNDSRRCSSVDTSDPSYRGNKNFAWWQVDLSDTYSVVSVTIFNTNDEIDWQYLYNFTVYVSYGSDVSDAAYRQVCQWVDPASIVVNGMPDVVRVPRNGSYTVNCIPPLVGQYVTIQRSGGESPGKMTLCEVAVRANKYYSTSACGNCLENCNPATGCARCNPGFVPPTCNKLCGRGTYGINCVNQCPQCPGTDVSCDSVTGICPDAVTPGSNMTSRGADGTDATGLQGNPTTRRTTSGVERFRNARATVFGALVLLAFFR